MTIDPAAHIDSVHLTIASLERSVRFYQQHVGFAVHRRDAASATLGAGDSGLLVLHESAAAPKVRGTTGLYHFAILVPSRPDLGRALRHLRDTQTPLQGFADHFVSEAIYLADPDGNGIEIYRDRPREEWPIEHGELRMGSDPLDVQGVVAAAGESVAWAGMPTGTRIGHVHFHVANLAEAERFYRDALGLDLMQRYNSSAAFLSAGGYHHHVAVNTWAGVGAPPPPAGAIGLKHVVIGVPDAHALDAVVRNLIHHDVAHVVTAGRVHVADPSGNALVIVADGG